MDAVTAIIDDLYAGTLDAARWEQAMSRIVLALRASCAVLFAFDPLRRVVLRDEGYHRAPPKSEMEVYRKWVSEGLEPRLALLESRPVLEPLVEQQLLPMREWRRSQIFNELLVKVDCTYFLCTWLHKSANRMVSLSFQASLRRGPFDETDRRRLQPLLPHLARALEIKDRLDLNSVRADTLAAGLSRASFGLMLLDARGHVVEANAASEDLLRDGRAVFRDRDGILRLRGRADGELRRWIFHGHPSGGGTDGIVHIDRPPQLPLSLLVAPVPEVVETWIGCQPRWMLFFFDPESAQHCSADLLMRDLGCTEREAELAALLGCGNDLQRAALRMDLSIHTTRAYLKSLFSRTGTHTQAQLVRRIMQSPAMALRQRRPA